MRKVAVVATALLALAAGCGGPDPGELTAAPWLFNGGGSGLVRFPAGGRVNIVAGFAPDRASNDPYRILVSGTFEVAPGWVLDGGRTIDVEERAVEVSTDHPARGTVEAIDSCGRSAKTDIEAVPAQLSIVSETEEWLAPLRVTATASGHAFVPPTYFELRLDPIDLNGEHLYGSFSGPVAVEGPLRIEGDGFRRTRVFVDGHEPGSTITFPGGGPFDVPTAPSDAAVRAEIWRLADRDVWESSTRITEPLELAVFQEVWFAVHAFDADNRLLLGAPISIETSREVVVAEDDTARRAIKQTFLLRGARTGSGTVTVRSAGAVFEIPVKVTVSRSR